MQPGAPVGSWSPIGPVVSNRSCGFQSVLWSPIGPAVSNRSCGLQSVLVVSNRKLGEAKIGLP